MLNNFLADHANSLQNDYLCILKEVISKFSTDYFPLIIDEINVFWFANRDLVKLILQNISTDYDCYAFTGATFLDVDDYEHYPFVALGKVHVVDDPLHKYSNIVCNIPNEDFTKQIKNQMLMTIEDNIKIIERCSGLIYILPVTLLSELNTDLIKDSVEQVFFSMFKDDTITFKQYCKDFRTIEDIEIALKDRACETLIFSEDEEEGNLCSRFRNFALNQPFPFGKETNEAMAFYYIVSGFFLQALNILLQCYEYSMIPYLRYEAIFRYTCLLGINFSGNVKIQTILYKCICANILYNIFNKDKIREVDFRFFNTTLDANNFDKNVFDALQRDGIDSKFPSFQRIAHILQEELDRLLVKLN